MQQDSISNFLPFWEIDRLKCPKFYLSWKRDFIFKFVYLQEFLSDLKGWDVKI